MAKPLKPRRKRVGPARDEPFAASGPFHPPQVKPPKKATPESNQTVGAIVTRRAADRLRAGHLWVYASDLESIALPNDAESEPPALLPVADGRGLFLGTALYSPSSQIVLRLVSRQALDQSGLLELVDSRLRAAIA